MSSKIDATAQGELIRSKATQLKRLLIAADAAENTNAAQLSDVETATQQLSNQLDEFFDEAIQRLEKRRENLQAALNRRLVAVEAANSGADRALLEEAVASSSASAGLLQRLDEAIALRERQCNIGDGIDLAEAERRARRLLDCLRLDWGCNSDRDDADGGDETWWRPRRASDPFAAVAKPAPTSESLTSNSAYGQLSASVSVDFSRVLSDSSGLGSAVGTRNSIPEASGPSSRLDTCTGKIDRGVSASSSSVSASVVDRLQSDNTRDTVSTDSVSGFLSNTYYESARAPETVASCPKADSSSDSCEGASSDSSDDVFEIDDCHTVGAPKSVTFVHERFYTVEGGCIRQYRCQDGRCLGKLTIRDNDWDSVDYHPSCVRSCLENDWLLIVDLDYPKVFCVDSDGAIQFEVGPRISAKYSLQDPVEAVSNGTHLFICCPQQAIFIVRFSDGKSVTQTIDWIGLSHPVRISWSRATNHLIVMNSEDYDDRYSFHAFEVTGSSGVGGLAKASDHCMRIRSDCEPDFVCLPDSDRVVFTLGLAMVRMFGRECLYCPQFNELKELCKDAHWGQITDICIVDEYRVAVCDKKTRWIRLLCTS